VVGYKTKSGFSEVSMLEKDKILHASASALIVIITSAIFCIFLPKWISISLGVSLGIMAGVFKEIVDVHIRKTNTERESQKDYLADVVGIVIGVILSYAIL
jgi:VanZ family protein